ncbi:unnamed protein product [Rhodiola kirilowii]
MILNDCCTMELDVCSEISSALISPRISFSQDLEDQKADPDIEAAQKYVKGYAAAAAVESESDSDFFFSIISPSKCLHEPCLAEEIFSNGKILPTQIKKKNLLSTHHKNSALLQPSVTSEPRKIRLKELLECEVEDEEEQKPAGTKSFWQFRRSSSFNCESGRAKGLMKSIQFLSRSKSTGSVPNPKQSKNPKISQKQSWQKQQQAATNHSDKSQFHYYSYGSSKISSGQKPPLGTTRSYGSGNVRMRIRPVLNMPLPPSYFCRGNVSLFEFGSLLCSGKDKSNKKKALS